MSKRLIMILTLAFVVGMAFGAYAEVQNVKVSGDLTVLGVSRQLGLTAQKAENTMISQTRLRVDADLTDNVSTTLRLLNERYWGTPGVGDLKHNANAPSSQGDANTYIDLDLAYVTMKEFLYSPLTLTVGRQEVHFGNDMIIGSATTNGWAPVNSVFSNTVSFDADLTLRKAFDAVRATLNYDPLVVDLVAAQISKTRSAQFDQSGVVAGTGNPALNLDDQETLFGGNLAYTLNKKTNLEAYAWGKRIGSKSIAVVIDKVDTTGTIGGRMSMKPIENLTVQAESAFQFGTIVSGNPNNIVVGGAATVLRGQNDLQRQAWAAQTSVGYDLKNAKHIGKYSPTATLMYSYFSGDSGTGKKYTGWDTMYENQTFGNLWNNLFPQTNQHILGAALTAKPVSDITLKGELYFYWWDKKFGDRVGIVTQGPSEAVVTTNKKLAGNEIDLTATYDYTEDVQFSLLGAVFNPLAAFDSRNRHSAGELIGKMKVTF